MFGTLKKQCAVLGLIFVVFFSNVFSAFAGPNAIGTVPQTSAVSAVLMDQNGVVLFEKNSHQSLPPASVTKSMTLLLAIEAVENGTIKEEDRITTSKYAGHQGGSQIWLKPGETMSVKEMMIAVAVVSANDAAVALMEHIYGSNDASVEAMNAKAKSLGLQNTHFANVNGLPAADHYMSSFDTALITKEAIKHPMYMRLCGIKEYWLRDGKSWLVNTNKLLWWYNGADGLKTGWTEEAKFCFAGTAKRDGLRLIAVVFAAPEPRSHLRESMKLLDWGFSNYRAVSVVEKGEVMARINVHKGLEKQVNLVAKEDYVMVLPKNTRYTVQKDCQADSIPNAPVQKNEKYGQMNVIKDNKIITTIDLVAEIDVPKSDYIHLLKDIMRNVFGCLSN